LLQRKTKSAFSTSIVCGVAAVAGRLGSVRSAGVFAAEIGAFSGAVWGTAVVVTAGFGG
jgi:hypothetical protein